MSYTRFSQLPLEVTNAALAANASKDEPRVCLRIDGVGNTTVLRFRGRTNRTYVFEWDRKLVCHALRIPASIYGMENNAIATDIFKQALPRIVIPTVEMPVPAPAPVEPEAPAEESTQQEALEASSEVEQEEPESTADESEPESGSSIPQRKRKKNK